MPQPPKPKPSQPPPGRAATLIENPGGPPTERAGTLIETDDEIRQALLAGLQGAPAAAAAAPTLPPPPTPAAPHASGGRVTSPFRPTARPRVPLLTVFDDGKTEGETIRIRDHKFVIGRTEGDLRIPIDSRISARHVEITHQSVGGLHRWVVTDLQSTHGMFVRVTRTVLADRSEFLVGNGRYRFDAAGLAPEATADYAAAAPDTATDTTRGWDDAPNAFRPPALTELLGNEIGNRLVLVKPEYWIGSDPGCPVSRPQDPFCEPRHARVYRGGRGGWCVEHNKTQNGLWLRMPQIVVDSMVQFQVGEQRFRLRV